MNKAETDYTEPEDLPGGEESEGLFEHHRLVADPGQSPMRLDKFLTQRLAHASRTKIQAGIEAGLIRVNNNSSRASYPIKPGDVVTVDLPHPPRNEEILPENIPLSVVYEDTWLMVVDKPAGLVVHPAHGNWTGTLVNGLLFHLNRDLPPGSAPLRPGLVHRIDKDTSGLLLIAKEEKAMMHLARQFFKHEVGRNYVALVWGRPEPAEGCINQRLARSPKDRRITEVTTREDIGKHAITHYQTLENFSYTTLIGCRLETGRTHQIRAHLKWLGHPLFGDAMYGGAGVVKGPGFSKYRAFVENALELCPRQALHARTLGFRHPASGEWMEFESPLPPDMEAVVAKWRDYQPVA